MARYQCHICGQVVGRLSTNGAPSGNCRRCGGKGTVWPEHQAKAYLAAKHQADEGRDIIDQLLTMHSQADAEQDSTAGRKIRRALAFLNGEETDDWTQTRDRMPTQEDADPWGNVFWRTNIYDDFREEGWVLEAMPWNPDRWYISTDIDEAFFQRHTHWKRTGWAVPKPPKT